MWHRVGQDGDHNTYLLTFQGGNGRRKVGPPPLMGGGTMAWAPHWCRGPCCSATPGSPPPRRVSNRPQLKAPQTLLVARWRRRPAPLVSGRRGGAKKPSSRTLSGVQHAQKVAELVGARQNGRNHLTVPKSCCHRQLLRWTTIMAGGTAQAAPKSRGCTLSASWWLQTA